MKGRISSENIADLKEGEIFVFGSNSGGYHSKFAAKQAMGWGAVYRQAEGLQGKTYGIPTKDKRIRVLPLNEIKPYVERFIEFARNNPQLTFLVTSIGCGAAGYKPKDIAPMFAEAV